VTRRGFTIIEIVVVVSIILILVAAASFMIEAGLRNQRDTVRVNDALLLGKAADQSIAATGGLVPRLVGTEVPAGTYNTTTRFCVADLLDGANTNRLDLGLFSGGSLPSDPAPILISSGHCEDSRFGYIFHTQYLTGSKPTQSDACTTGKFALCANATYAIEVGLENQHADITLQTPAQIGASGYAAPSAARHPYLLMGAACSVAYAQTCYR